MIDSGEAKNQAELARIKGISRTRVTQILNLLKIDDKIIIDKTVKKGGKSKQIIEGDVIKFLDWSGLVFYWDNRPGTTIITSRDNRHKKYLEYFGLSNLSEMPKLSELAELEKSESSQDNQTDAFE